MTTAHSPARAPSRSREPCWSSTPSTSRFCAAIEGRPLAVLAPQLEIAIPDWRVSTERLIACPLLPGVPGPTVRGDGTVDRHVDMASTEDACRLGAVIAQLHAVDRDAAATTGIPSRTPAQVREGWRADLARFAESFELVPALRERWEAWLAEDSYWPGRSVLTHGELHPGHTLVSGERISAVLDWTTSAVGVPARDFMSHRASAPPEAVDAALATYADGGGILHSRLGEHSEEMFSAPRSPTSCRPSRSGRGSIARRSPPR